MTPINLDHRPKWPPKVGPTGSKVVIYSIEKFSNAVPIHVIPEPKPTRWMEHSVLDDQGYEIRRVQAFVTDAQFEAAMERWQKVGKLDIFYAAGPSSTTIKVECKDGSEAEGCLVNGRCAWTRAGTVFR